MRLRNERHLAATIVVLPEPQTKAEAVIAGLPPTRLLARADPGVEIAGETVAVADYEVIDLLERDRPRCRITALLTAAAHRRRGAARALVGAIELAARDRGCFRLEVTTRPQRADALSLYAAMGFRERPRRLVKALPLFRSSITADWGPS